MLMKPSGKVELLIISALLQPCHRSSQAKRQSRAPHIVALLGSVSGGKDTSSFYNFQIFRLFFLFRQFFIKSLEVSNNYRNFAAGIKERIKLWHQLHLKIVHAMK